MTLGIEDKIISSAVRIISNEGLSSFSFTKLAKMCCCSKSTLYSIFESKEDLIVGIYTRNINQITSFNREQLINDKLSIADKMILCCMYDVIRVAKEYDPADRVSLIATIPKVYYFASSVSLSKQKMALIKLNETFEQIEEQFVINGFYSKEKIKNILNVYRLQARGMVSCISNPIYFEHCISSSLNELYLGFLSVLDEKVLENITITYDDCFFIINDYLIKRKSTDH